MATNHESGHAKNVANIEKLISFCKGYGESYNPSNTDIGIEALTSAKTAAQTAQNNVNTIKATIEQAIAARKKVFNPFPKFITRLSNAVKASKPSEQIVNNVNTLVRKLQGRRASAKLTEKELKSLSADGKEVKQISASQLSLDSRIENFSKLITLLTTVAEYKPNEEELQIAALNTKLEDLKSKNTAVVDAETQLSNALIIRNQILYNPDNGLMERALTAKQYIKSVFGASSPQYKQISSLEFKKYKK